jgi:hypothetical protein
MPEKATGSDIINASLEKNLREIIAECRKGKDEINRAISRRNQA